MNQDDERFAVVIDHCKRVQIGTIKTYGGEAKGAKVTSSDDVGVGDVTHYSNAYLETVIQLDKAIDVSGMPPEVKSRAKQELKELKSTDNRESFFEKYRVLMSTLSDHAQVASTALTYAAVLATVVPF